MKIVNYEEYRPSDIEFEDLPIVRQIISDVKQQGDKAILDYTKRFDGIEMEAFEVSKKQINDAYQSIDPSILDAMTKARDNIKMFAQKQRDSLSELSVEVEYGEIGHNLIPIDKVGCYVPGGRYPLPSSALMTIVPAVVAGSREIIVCSPKITSETIVAADMAGATRIFSVGGAQAIAAMAMGTESIPKVDKVVGPGNKYVNAAKKEVYGIVGIDFIAGPSEVLVIADDAADPRMVAADLIAQAEHDEIARANCICLSHDFADNVLTQLNKQLEDLPTANVARVSLENGKIFVVPNLNMATELANTMAAEHLEIMIEDPSDIVEDLRNYGSLFIGKNSAEVFGDYCSGPNHTLPTNGSARFTGGLSVLDFIKVQTYQQLNQSIEDLIRISSDLGRTEGLEGHARAAEIRKKSHQIIN